MLRLCLFGVAPLLGACGDSDTGGVDDPGVGSGSGTISGDVAGHQVTVVSSSWLIGAPDDPKRTRVLYVFDHPVTCTEITAAGWDETVTDATAAIEMKLIGTTAGDYPITANGRPGTGEADANYTLTAQVGTPAEVSAIAGHVKLDQIVDGQSADGTLDLTFPAGHVMGAFHAGFCGHGREP